MSTPQYTTQLQAGLGMVPETGVLLDLWCEGMGVRALENAALQSGRFPNVSARRLHNIVGECFGPRYLSPPTVANTLKIVRPSLSTAEFLQLLYLYTCRAVPILFDFVGSVYWPAFAAGKNHLSTDDASDFVQTAIADGRTTKAWSDSVRRRVSGYLTGCCADFGLLESGKLSERAILPFRIESRLFVYLAYDLHLSGLSDASVLEHSDWQLFGLEEQDVLEEMKRQSPKGLWLVQSAGALARITWLLRSREELIDGFVKGQV